MTEHLGFIAATRIDDNIKGRFRTNRWIAAMPMTHGPFGNAELSSARNEPKYYSLMLDTVLLVHGSS
jgi:hypothetical protein